MKGWEETLQLLQVGGVRRFEEQIRIIMGTGNGMTDRGGDKNGGTKGTLFRWGLLFKQNEELDFSSQEG